MGFGAVLGAAAGLAGNVIGSIADNIQKEQAATLAYERSKEFYQNRHQWEVQDLQKSGLNPILSAGGQPPSNAAAMSPGSNFQAGANAGINSAISVMNAGLDLESKAADIDNKNAMTGLIMDQRSTETAKTNMYRTQALMNNAQAQNLQRQSDFWSSNPQTFRDMMITNAAPRSAYGLGYGLVDSLRSSGALDAAARKLGSFLGGKK